MTSETYAKAQTLKQEDIKSQVPKSNEVYNPQVGVHDIL